MQVPPSLAKAQLLESVKDRSSPGSGQITLAEESMDSVFNVGVPLNMIYHYLLLEL